MVVVAVVVVEEAAVVVLGADNSQRAERAIDLPPPDLSQSLSLHKVP